MTAARTLVEEGLIACGSAVPCTSVYSWKDAIEESDEIILMMKTRTELVARVIERAVELHSYEVPEAIAIGLDDGHLPYLEWIASVTVDR